MANHANLIDEALDKSWGALKILCGQELKNENALLMKNLTSSLKNLSVLKKMEEEERWGSEHSYTGHDRSRMYWDPMMYGDDYRNSYRMGGMSYNRGGRNTYEMDGNLPSRMNGHSRSAREHLESALHEAETEKDREAIRKCLGEMN